MAQTDAPHVVGIRFQEVGQLYHFDSTAFPQAQLGDFVIVETTRGRQLGQIMGLIPPDRVQIQNVKPIKRMANARDMLMMKLYEAKDVEALVIIREEASKDKSLVGAKFIKANFNYDGSVLTVLYTSEDPVETNKLRRQLGDKLRTRIDMRRIGARDAAKLLGEYGACGGPRCCSTHLTEFSPVSIKMAKAQGISLNPSEITGMCGRLRCCLVYEYEQYVEARKTLPKRKKIVGTPHGEGKVINQNPLKQTVTVIAEGNRHEVHIDDIVPLEELRALQEASAKGCTKEGGVCDCGSRVRPGQKVEAAAPEEDQPEAASDATQTDPDRRQKPVRRNRRGGRRGSRGTGKTTNEKPN